jgi:uncharacterized protein VcgC/VcgE DUF2780
MGAQRTVTLSVRHIALAIVACWLASVVQIQVAAAAAPSAELVAHLQDTLGLDSTQVRRGLGALLVFARERLPKPQFDDLASKMPNAEQAMQSVKLQGVVTGPLDDIDAYEATLVRLGIGPSVASQFAPAVVDWLANAGFHEESDILSGVLH